MVVVTLPYTSGPVGPSRRDRTQVWRDRAGTRITATLRRHVDHPDFISAGHVQKLRAEVAGLEAGLGAIEGRSQ